MLINVNCPEDRKLLVAAFNTWMLRYESDPEGFEREFNTVAEFRREVAEGREPSYGEVCADYLISLVSHPLLPL